MVLEALPLTPSGKVDRRALPAPESAAADDGTDAGSTDADGGGAGGDLGGGAGGGAGGGGGRASSTWGATRCWRRRWSPARGRRSGWRCRCGRSSRRPRWRRWPARIEALRSAGRLAGAAASSGSRARRGRGCRSPSRSSGSGWWTGWSPGAPPTTCRTRCGCAARWTRPALRASLDELVRRHETLRTTFAEQGGGPVQVIHPPARGAAAGARPGAVCPPERGSGRRSAWPAAEALRPFDLARGPLLRCGAAAAGRGPTTCSASPCTTWSATAGACRCWCGRSPPCTPPSARGEPSRLPELPVQYADYAVWQRGWLSGETLEAQIGFWKERAARRPAAAGDPHGPPARGGAGPARGEPRLRAPARAVAGAAGALAPRRGPRCS